MKAKDVSFWVIIFAVVWVLSLALVKAFLPVTAGVAFGLSIVELIAGGVFFVIAFTPIYRSIWLDKKLGIAGSVSKPGMPKKVSLWVIIFAVAWVWGLLLLKGFSPLYGYNDFGMNIYEIIGSGVFFVIAFTPIYRSIWLDKKMEAVKAEGVI